MPPPKHLLHTARLGLALLVFAFASAVLAIEIPPIGSAAFIQTSGPNAGINIGDYYTSVNGEPNAAERLHRFQVEVPCAWPAATPITFALFDPEMFDNTPQVDDEVRGATDTTSFTLITPNRTINQTFPGVGATNNLWVELVTTTTAADGCGTYLLEVTTSDNDDNAWRLRVSRDPDCTVTPGTCSPVGAGTSGLMNNGNETNDVDGLAGTGDELTTSFTRTSYQHVSPVGVTTCQRFFWFVDGTVNPLVLHNFDMDVPGLLASIEYTRPNGTVIPGTESINQAWNNGAPFPPAPPPRAGDSIALTLPDDIGWWSANVCVTENNQYIFEGPTGVPIFFDQPPTPEMTIAKDDGQTIVSSNGQQVTYVIDYANIGTGAAINAVITDVMPAGATFVDCTDQNGTPGACVPNGAGPGTVTWNLGIVPAPPSPDSSGSVTLTVDLPPALPPTQHINTVSVDYTDLLGNEYPDPEAEDIDDVLPAAPEADLSIVKDNGVGNYTPGGPISYTITVRNLGPDDANGATVTDNFPAVLLNPVWTCAPGAGAACTAGPVAGNINDTVNIPANGSIVYTVNATVDPGATGPIENVARVDPPPGTTDPNPNNNEDNDIDVPPGAPTPTPDPNNPDPGVPGVNPGQPQLVSDPSISKTVLPPFALPGQSATFTIAARNPGTTPMTNVTISDTMPAELRIVSADASSGTVTISGQTARLTLATLAPGQSVTLSITVQVSANAQPPYVLTNRACLAAGNSPQRCAEATLASVGRLPETGETPWWRLPLLAGLGLLVLAGGALVLRRLSDGGGSFRA